MTVSFYQDIDDVMAFQEHAVLRTPGVRKMVMRSRILLLVLIVMLDLVMGNASTGSFGLPVVGLVLGLLAFVLYPKLYNRMVLARLRNVMLDPLNDSYFGLREMTLSEEGLAVNGDHSNSFVEWEGIKKVERTHTHIFVYISAQQAHTIPANKVSAEEFVAIAAYLETHTK